MVWNKKGFWQILLLLAAVLCLVIGVQRGEMKMVFEKAVRICLECIGIG